MSFSSKTPDSDAAKGATESDRPTPRTPDSLSGQLGHRERDEMVKDNDSDFPEPGLNPEHSGQHK